jgi:hypothetical protein
VKRIKKDLIKALEQKGIIASVRKLAENNGILTILQEQKKEEGWVGRPKGMLQILWE